MPFFSDLTGLVGYWNYEETGGDLIDQCGNTDSNDCISNAPGVLNGPVQGESGLILKSYRFEGIDDEILIPHNSGQQMSTWTINCWINVVTAPGTNRFPALLGKGSGGESSAVNQSFGLHMFRSIFGVNNGWGSFYETSSGSNQTLATEDALAGQGWVMLTAILNDATNRWSIWKNGVEINFKTDAVASNNLCTALMYMGPASIGTIGGLNAFLDEESLWNRALSGTELLELYNGGAGLSLLSPPPAQQQGINIEDKGRVFVDMNKRGFNRTAFNKKGQIKTILKDKGIVS